MKIIFYFFVLLHLSACAGEKEDSYTGSTPAGKVVKSFLGINFSDSIDFIRWNITLGDSKYTLNCNYGIGKPNTNGFIDGGKTIKLSGVVKKEKNYYYLHAENKTLRLLSINNNLLHLLDDDNSLLIGNGGWSYTLNNKAPINTNETSIIAKQQLLSDSMVFEGRTPCSGLADYPPGDSCYKLKWYIVLYADRTTNQPTTYKIKGTAYRKTNGKSGVWSINKGKDGRIVYQLYGSGGKPVIYMLKLDANILVFIDANGNLLTGDRDFSYTLNNRG